MADKSSAQQTQEYQHQEDTSLICKQCGMQLDTEASLDIHRNYAHKENILNQWTNETNNNNNFNISSSTKTKSTSIRELMIATIAAAADSSDSKKSPEYHRATPENNMFGHPPTPQSYQSGSSPYQNQENTTFSPNFQNYSQIKAERLSPSNNHFQNHYNYNDQHYFPLTPMDTPNSQQSYNQDYPVHKTPNSYRYHPYQPSQHSPFERPQSQSQVSSSSPAYPPQPTPSPSPKTCDKCGFVCDSASQLIDHLNIAHPPTPAPHLSAFQSNQHFMFGNDGQQQLTDGKLEDDSQSEILDLDSHKVHQVFPEDDKRPNGDPNPHSVTALIGNWSPQQTQNQKMFQQEQQRMFMNNQDQKMFNPNETKMFQNHQDFMGNGVSTTSQEPLGHSPTPTYRPFEHLPAQPNTPVISSTQVPNATTPVAPPSTKSASWKSNEARRPKTYNCTACNKWFTSSGHLKRHYNTTLHKNAVKSSGQPDPASLPISAHHHPARDNSSREDRTSNSPGEDSRGDDGNSMPPQFERPSPLPGLLQQPPNGPYDRQPAPNIHQPPPLHSPMGHNPPLGNPMVSLNNLTPTNGSPPNGEAGPSALNLDSRGLLSLSANPNTVPGFNMAPPMMPMESNQFQMYPNESAPHVTQDMATNSLNTTGELQFITDNSTAQPLPSFAQIQAHRGGLLLSYEDANVGGGGSVTAPYTYFTENPFETIEHRVIYKPIEYDGDYKLTILTTSDQMNYQNENDNLLQYDQSPPTSQYSPSQDFQNNNITAEEEKMQIMSDMKIDMIKQKLEAQPGSPEKAHIKRDYEESTGSPRISSTTIQPKANELFKCFECDKSFNKACYLTQHNKTFHSGDKPFKCQRCGKRFSNEVLYQEHSAKHAGEKPHKCDLCPKQFNHKTDLRRHMCLHTGQKPYACETCGKGFIRKDHMLKHCETHTRKAQLKASTGLR